MFSFGSFCLNEPPAAFLGLAKFFFILLKSFLLIKISHLISNKSGILFPFIFLELNLMVFKFSKISSPVTPSPLENLLLKFLFHKLMLQKYHQFSVHKIIQYYHY